MLIGWLYITYHLIQGTRNSYWPKLLLSDISLRSPDSGTRVVNPLPILYFWWGIAWGDSYPSVGLISAYVPWSKLPIWEMVIPPSIGNPPNGYINRYYWVNDHPLPWGINGSLAVCTYSNLYKHCHNPMTFSAPLPLPFSHRVLRVPSAEDGWSRSIKTFN